MPKNESVWDIQDRCPIDIPTVNGKSSAAFELGVRQMPYAAQQRYLRAVDTLHLMDTIKMYADQERANGQRTHRRRP